MQPNDTILTEYRADMRNFQRGAKSYDATLARQERLTNTRLNRIDQRWERSTRSILTARTALAALGGVAGARALGDVRRYGEEWRNVERRLQSIGVTSEEGQQGLIELAIRTRSSVQGTAAAVQRMSKSTGDGIELTTRRVETLQKLLAAGGATGTERASVSLQLGQALQSGVLSGDEFRSIRENAPVEFLDALANAAGVTRQELKKFAEDQRLTTEVVLRALDGLASTADEKFGQLAVSGDEAFSVLTSGLVAYVGRVDEALGATASINGALTFLGEYLAGAGEGAETMAEAIRVAGVVALATAGSRGVGALTASLQRAAAGRLAVASAAREEVAASQAAVAQSRRELDAANLRQRTAQQALRARAAASRVTKTATLEAARADRAQAKAATALAGAQARATGASVAMTAAQRQLSAATRITTGALRAAQGVMAFFGGPIGLAFTGISATLAIMATRTSEVDRLTQSATERVQELEKAYIATGGRVDELRKKVGSLSLAQAITDAEDFARKLADAQDAARGTLDQPLYQGLFRKNPEFAELVNQLVDGTIRVQEFRQGVDDLVRKGDVGFARLVQIFGSVLDPLLSVAEGFEEANDAVAVLNGTAEEAEAAMQRLGLSMGDAGESADALAAKAGAAAKGIAGLISQIPALRDAAKVQEQLTQATKDRDAALSELGDPVGWGPEEAARAAEINDLFRRASTEIDGTAAASRRAGKELESYIDAARIGDLDDRNQALAREQAQYERLVDSLRAAKASQQELDAAEAAYQARRAQINSGFDERASNGRGGRGSAERDLASARALLAEHGNRALYIEQELNRERERLRGLLPELISLGLSRAEAEGLIAAQLEETRKRLGDFKTASAEASEAFASNILQDVRAADSLSDAIGRIASRLSDLAYDGVFDVLAERFAGLGSSGSGGTLGLLGNAFSFLFNAKGNAFNKSGVVPFAKGGIVDRPTFFGFGGNRLGVMGEEDPEAILPLQRASDGRLGVVAVAPAPTVPRASVGAMMASAVFNWTGDMVIQSNSDNPQEVGREATDQMRVLFMQLFGKEMTQAMRPGGVLDQKYQKKAGT